MANKEELIKQVNAELIDLGTKLKKNLWTEEDKKVLRQRAVDLVSLNIKVESTQDEAKKAEYRLAAGLVLQGVQSMALLKMLIAEEALLEALKNLLWDLLVSILERYLPGLKGGKTMFVSA